MPQEYKKKTARSYVASDCKAAIEDVIKNNLSLRVAALKYGISKSRLSRLVQATKNNFVVDLVPNYKHCRVISDEMEKMLVTYLLTCSAMYHGLSPASSRRLIYEFAKSNQLIVPKSWDETKKAGEAWFTSFVKRHSELSIRSPEATSLARITSFNKYTIGTFFDKLQDVLKRVEFSPNRIFNLDETGISTVAKVQKVLARKGLKQVGQVTSAERGESITQVGIICANGNALPPVWVFPRMRFDSCKMMAGAPSGALGLVHKSGWMTSENFVHVLKFLRDTVRCSNENSILLILDNHDSHLSLEGINFCKENGIMLLTLPPHTSNKTQPLDRSVFGPFKKFYAASVNSWMLENPNQVLNIYHLPKLCSQAWDRAATPGNIKAGFKACGIIPFDRYIFQEEEFLPSFVSDRPNPVEVLADGNVPTVDVAVPITPQTMKHPSKSEALKIVTPEAIRPFPKAQPRKIGTKGRKRGRCRIATDTPEKLELEEEKSKKIKKTVPKPKKLQRKKLDFGSSDEEEQLMEDLFGKEAKTHQNFEDTLLSSSGGEWMEESSDDDDIDLADFFSSCTEVNIDDWVLVEFHGKKSFIYYIGQVLSSTKDEATVKFLKRAKNQYVWPNVEDVSNVSLKNIKKTLGTPQSRRGYFSWDLLFPSSLTIV